MYKKVVNINKFYLWGLLILISVTMVGCFGIGTGNKGNPTGLLPPDGILPPLPPTGDLFSVDGLLTTVAPFSNMLFPGSGGLLLLAARMHHKKKQKETDAKIEEHNAPDSGIDVILHGILESSSLEGAKVLATVGLKMKRIPTK